MRAVVLALALLPSVAWAHDSWINKGRMTDPQSGEWCCNANDCDPEEVREVSGGYSTLGGDVVPYARVIWKSADGRWWRCRYLGGVNKGKTRCLIGPPPGT